MGLTYLATPYSDSDPAVRQRRFEVVNCVAADLIIDGAHIFSPISHTHPIAEAGSLPCGWEFWGEYDLIMLKASEKLIVLRQAGWEKSVGVAGEIGIARELGLLIEYMDPLYSF